MVCGLHSQLIKMITFNERLKKCNILPMKVHRPFSSNHVPPRVPQSQTKDLEKTEGGHHS